MIKPFFSNLGTLRGIMAVVVVILAVAAPFAGGGVQYTGWRMLPTLIAPAVAPIFFFVLPLDMMMCGVYMSGQSEAERARYRYIIRADLVLWLLLTLAWGAFFFSLIQL